MSDNKKYYYLKLKENFFEEPALELLESMENGYIYSNILLKLYLKSLRNEGRLAYNDRIPYNSKVIAQMTKHNIDFVEKAIRAFKELELIDILDNGAIYMLDIQNFIGESSTEADRIRDYRNRINKEKYNLKSIDSKKEHVTNVQDDSVQMYCKSTPEIRDKRLENRYKRIDHKSIEQVSENDFFESIWKLYPNKRGKSKVSIKQIKELQKLGYDKIKLCIERYINTKPSWQEWQHGSSFFNKGYIDFLDDNFNQESHNIDFYRKVD